MIKEVNGDILLSSAQVIAHGVAPNDHFNSGLALSLRENFPVMYKDFRHYCYTEHPKPGGAWLWKDNGKFKYIANLLTQEPPLTNNSNPGRASIIHVNHALRELAKLIQAEDLKSVALPRLATGVGGLDWEEVRPVIYQYLDGLEVPVFLYTQFSKGVRAVE